jgi:elongation factor P
MKFLYTNKGEFWFCEEKDPSKRSALSPEIIGDNTKFLKPNSFVDILTFDDQVIGVQMPIKVELLVKEAAAAVKGNTAQGGTKQVTLETGAVINTPMFINEGDVIVINTETGEYVERKGGKF